MPGKTASRIILPVLLSLGFCVPHAASAQAALPGETAMSMSDSQPLTAFELYALYRDRTWQWQDGGARFSDGQRQLVAWVKKGDDETFAEGRWTVNDNGRMCMQAVWKNKAGAAPARTCFDHRRIGDTIYQRRVTGGDWYVFKHPNPQSTDEFTKLVADDAISANAARLKDALKAKN